MSKIVELLLTKKPKDIVKTFKKGVDIKSLNKAGEEVVSTVDKVGDVIDKTKQIASTEPSDNKKVGNGGKFTGTGYGADY